MDRFVFGTDEQFEALEQELENGMLKIYNQVELPNSFNKHICRIGFEKHSVGYKILIDYGYTCSVNVPAYFKIFLEEGELIFMDYYDVKMFFKSLNCLYQ